jgi:MFS family permease
MSASAYLITIVCLAAVFAVGVFIGAKLERSSPGVATFAYRAGLLAGYAAVMTAAVWVLNAAVPPAYDWLVDIFGSKPVFLTLCALWAIGAVIVYRAHQRHNQRQRSGRFLEPREP